MQKVIGVSFQCAGKIYTFSGGDDIDLLCVGDKVLAETVQGLEMGTVMVTSHEIDETTFPTPIKPILRKATEEDFAQYRENCRKEKEAFKICQEKILQRELSMKLIKVSYTFDVNKIIFYFTADGRVDFRELVKDLAAIFKTRIELRQIGVRDEAKFLGGIGCCGRPLCCATFLNEFGLVSIRMAKAQHLSLNPSKISGICGRLMCCLQYENDNYEQSEEDAAKKNLRPKVGSRVLLKEGEGKIISLQVSKKLATILLDSGKTFVKSWEEISETLLDPIDADELTESNEFLEDSETNELTETNEVDNVSEGGELTESNETNQSNEIISSNETTQANANHSSNENFEETNVVPKIKIFEKKKESPKQTISQTSKEDDDARIAAMAAIAFMNQFQNEAKTLEEWKRKKHPTKHFGKKSRRENYEKNFDKDRNQMKNKDSKKNFSGMPRNNRKMRDAQKDKSKRKQKNYWLTSENNLNDLE